MDILWAPWRMTYIAGDTGEKRDGAPATTGPADPPSTGAQGGRVGCIFCDKVAEGPAADARNLILWRGTHTFALLNLYPYNSGHLMIVPYRHLASVLDLTPAENGELMAALQLMIGVLGAVYRPEGYNVGMNLGRVAGAGIADHVHLHVVPRWNGDTNFMPVLGQTKVLPEALETTWARLTAALITYP